MEYNSPFNNNKVSNDKNWLIKNNKTINNDQRSITNNKDFKNLNINSFSNNNKIENDKEKEENNIYNNYIKKKSNQKIIIESKFDISTSSTNKTIKKPINEDSNSLAIDNQSTNANNNNSNSNATNEHNNNYSFSPVSAFCLNNNTNTNTITTNTNKNPLFNDICLETNDKVIKELESELEQTTAKKEYKSIEKEKEKIEPKNLNKTTNEEKEILDSSDSNKNNNNLFLNINNKKDIIRNSLKNSRKINSEYEKEIKLNLSLKKEKNELILYGNNPKAIDKKFFMTDKKLLDLEEFTKDKFIEIKNQIEKLKVLNPENNQQRSCKSNHLSFNSYRDKGTNISNNTKNDNNNSINNTSFTNNMSNKLIFLNQKINENKSARKNLENSKKEFDLTCHNFRKNKFYNFEQINQKIFNSSCKKIKTYSNDEKEREKEKSLLSPSAKEYIKNKIVGRNDISALDHKKSDNNIYYEKKKYETIENNIKAKNNESKRQKNRNISSGNIYLTQKNGENVSFNEADIKLVYLNKFVNNKLPYAPSEAFLGEK